MQVKRSILLLLIISILLIQALFSLRVFANNDISAVILGGVHKPGETFQVLLSLTNPVDFYYADADILFDYSIIEFIDVEDTGLSEGGLSFSGIIQPGHVGVSVSRTDRSGIELQGSFMQLNFRILDFAFAGETILNFLSIDVSNSTGETLISEPPSDVVLNISEAITFATLTSPELIDVQLGESFEVGAKVFVSGICDPLRVRGFVGVSAIDTHPSLWEEDNWIEITYHGCDDSNMSLFSDEVLFSIQPGTWNLAARFSLDNGDFFYGGVDGIWDNFESPGALLVMHPRPPFRYTLALWDFLSSSLYPSNSLPENRNSVFQIENASFNGFGSGYNGPSADSRGWNSPGQPGYWMVKISTAGFFSLELSSRQYGSNTGPRDFMLEYSLDGVEWYLACEQVITVDNNWTSGILDKLLLPAEVENRDELFIRWRNSSGYSIAGSEISSAGTNRIDDILITGVSSISTMVDVYPGDTNNDGAVNSDDILPLALYWQRKGPPAINFSNGFQSRLTEEWIPAPATYADTDGDGTVDHRDLKLIGLNFGKSRNGKKIYSMPLSTLQIDPVIDGNELELVIYTESAVEVRGVSFRLNIKGISSDMYIIDSLNPMFSKELVKDELLSFVFNSETFIDAAVACKGEGDNFNSRFLAKIVLKIDDSWTTPFVIDLDRLTLSNATSASIPVSKGGLNLLKNLSKIDLDDPEPYVSLLLQNYPNPFHDKTMIPVNTNESSYIKIDISDLTGRVIQTLFSGVLEPGYHEFEFSRNGLPQGLYFCRLTKISGFSESIRMAIIEGTGN